MTKKNRVYLGNIRGIIMDASVAGLIKWEPTDCPPVPFKTRSGSITLRGFRAVVDGLGVETIVVQRDSTDPAPGQRNKTDNFVFGFRISKENEEITFTTDPKVIPGNASAELVHGMDYQASFVRFCEDIQYWAEERDLLDSLHGHLLRLFHPA